MRQEYSTPLKIQLQDYLTHLSEDYLMALYSSPKLPKQALELITNELLTRLNN